MKRALAALTAAFLFSTPAFAQITPGSSKLTAVVVATCGAESLTPGNPNVVYIDETGDLCTGATLTGSVTIGAITIASGGVASGAYAAGSFASGMAVAGAFADGSLVTLGLKADAKSTATDTTPVTAMSVLKEISAMEQAPASRAVTNAGTFAVQLSGATNNINNIAGTISLPTGASTSALQTTGNTALTTINTTLSNASQKTQIVDGSGNVIASTSNNLDVQCANCSGSGVSTADGASFTAGASLFAGIGGAYQTSATSNPLTAGDQGFAQLTHYRALMTDWYNSGGTEMGTTGSPVYTGVADGANVTAGAKADARSTATDTTAVTLQSVEKEISYMEQNPASRAVTNAGTFAVQLSGATNNINNVSGTVSLPTGASTSANQTGGGQKTQIVDGSGNVIASTSNRLNVVNLPPVGAAAWSPNVVSVGTGATLIVAARTGVPGTGRVSVTIMNTAQTVSLCLGPTSGVTTSNGFCLPAIAGAAYTINTTAAVYGVWGDAGTHNVSFSETY